MLAADAGIEGISLIGLTLKRELLQAVLRHSMSEAIPNKTLGRLTD
jgi:hypothetical protein